MGKKVLAILEVEEDFIANLPQYFNVEDADINRGQW